MRKALVVGIDHIRVVHYMDAAMMQKLLRISLGKMATALLILA